MLHYLNTFKKNMSFNMSPFKYFKSVSAGMHQNFNFLAGAEPREGG